MSFDLFIESLENVPPELARNFTLMTDLDRRSGPIIKEINDSIKEYRETSKRTERLAIKSKTNDLFAKLNSLADEKVGIALQTYELIDKNIRRLTSLQPQVTDEDGVTEIPMIGFDMPLDPNEPKYCICRGVSHGEMIACDNKECLIEWFHYPCVGLTSAPKGKWYCGQCIQYNKPKPRSRRSSKRY